MEGIAMIISFVAGIACAFFVGVRIGRDKGYSKGVEEATNALMEIHEQGNAAIKEGLDDIKKIIDPDCGWK